MQKQISFVDGVPVISIVAWSNSGKTTFFEQVVAILSKKGIKVGLIKHHAHTSPIDIVGKDSWRYAQAGAIPVVVSSPEEYAVFRKRPDGEASLEDLCKEISSEVDVILTEGYKYEGMSKIEFSRKDFKPEPVEDSKNLIALISDDTDRRAEFDALDIPNFNLEDITGVATFIESLLQG